MNLSDAPQLSKQLDRVRIVMVNTTLPANIGSALRAMKTMGLSKLVLVAPKTYPHADIDALAAGAQDLIAQIEIVETLEQPYKIVTWYLARVRVAVPFLGRCWMFALPLKKHCKLRANSNV